MKLGKTGQKRSFQTRGLAVLLSAVMAASALIGSIGAVSAAEPEDKGENLALHKDVLASTVEKAEHDAPLAVDGEDVYKRQLVHSADGERGQSEEVTEKWQIHCAIFGRRQLPFFSIISAHDLDILKRTMDCIQNEKTAKYATKGMVEPLSLIHIYAVVDNDMVAVAGVTAGRFDNRTAFSRDNRRAVDAGAGNINGAVSLQLTGKGIVAVAKIGCNILQALSLIHI